MFINFDVNAGLTINSFRKPAGYANDDIGGLVHDILAGRCGNCPLDGAKDALEIGYFWQGSNATQELLEELHALICEHEARESAEA